MSRIPLAPALEVIRQLRTDQVVITTMGATREWPRISNHPLDFHYIPSSMGQSPSIGLGLALARPEREVIVFTGDGSLLMNLGCLATLAASGAKNLTLVLLDNGVYEVTGGQKTAGQIARADFAAFATAAGIESVATFDDLIDWQNGAAAVFKLPGPRFILLIVEPVRDDYFLNIPGPIRPRIEKLQAAMGIGPSSIKR
jgi:sulfopyruvate decarboxylase subunit beta